MAVADELAGVVEYDGIVGVPVAQVAVDGHIGSAMRGGDGLGSFLRHRGNAHQHGKQERHNGKQMVLLHGNAPFLNEVDEVASILCLL